ncbi:stem 28 kDa glycoprotein-like [Abrus precatorius]|uniref:Stem 28 kDa glycoprotein-like n=1 Tax=Abrus precatorius TaxID=3816 RepID=A0A8B8JTM8_ABRPR|nr:stem 28 kDa glycoprotein-like [Abrus precatorius]
MRTKIVVFFLATILASCHGLEHGANFQIFPLRMKTGSGGHYIPEVSCLSWRLGVEAHNMIDWKTVPEECKDYIGNYIIGDQYRSDSKTVCREAYLYAKKLNLTAKDIFVFDVDETTLSNLPYYANHGFGVEPYNPTLFNEWVDQGSALALPESLKLYNKLVSLGIKIVFLTGRPENQRDVTATNLKSVGYHTWEKLIVKDTSVYAGKTAVTYKSSERKKLESQGYRIIGNIGDQWSDILGTNTGDRTFKLPDPMYYIS